MVIGFSVSAGMASAGSLTSEAGFVEGALTGSKAPTLSGTGDNWGPVVFTSRRR